MSIVPTSSKKRGMDEKLTVYFDGQYWVGVVEDITDDGLKACRYVFGAEPSNQEVGAFVKERMLALLRETSQTVELQDLVVRRVNPKRLARQVASEVQGAGVSTYAQEVLKKELESRKVENKTASRNFKKVEKERKRLLARQKAKKKHRGR